MSARFIGGGGAGFFVRLGGGGGAFRAPFAAFVNVRLPTLPCEVAGLTDRSPYDLSGLPLLRVESSDGSPKTLLSCMLTRFDGRRFALRDPGSCGTELLR